MPLTFNHRVLLWFLGQAFVTCLFWLMPPTASPLAIVLGLGWGYYGRLWFDEAPDAPDWWSNR